MKLHLKNILVVSLLILILGFIRIFVFQIFIVSGNSMHPAIKNGDILFVVKSLPCKLYAATFKNQKSIDSFVKKNDIFIFKNDQKEELVKRVVGVPFEFYFFQNGQIKISDKEIDHSLQNDLEMPASLNPKFIPLSKNGRIPEGYYLFLGDNRDHSTDSRNFGLVPEDSLIGKVLWKL